MGRSSKHRAGPTNRRKQGLIRFVEGLAVPVKRPELAKFQQTIGVEMPWEMAGLSRADRVIAFLEPDHWLRPAR